MRTVDVTERRARLGRRHRLDQPADDPVEATTAMVGLHSSDPVTVFLSTWARVGDLAREELEHALYADRTLVRFYGMRRTLWVIDRDIVPNVHHSSTRTLAVRERKRTIKLLEAGGITDDGASWLDAVLPKTLACIRERGEVLTRDLTGAIPELDGKIVFRNLEGKSLGSTGLASRAVLQLSMESKLVRARPAGTWVSGQYRWTDTSWWLGGPIPEISPGEASAGLIRRWLRAFGPASEVDLKWWTGWNLSQLRQALSDVCAVEVRLQEGTGYLLPDDVEPVEVSAPWVALLPSLDPTTMGWKERDWYLGGHGDLLFDRNGNAGPTVWVDGRVVGGWAQRDDGTIAYELLEDVDSSAKRLIATRAEELGAWLGGVVITPRFRSPHDKSLTS